MKNQLQSAFLTLFMFFSLHQAWAQSDYVIEGQITEGALAGSWEGISNGDLNPDQDIVKFESFCHFSSEKASAPQLPRVQNHLKSHFYENIFDFKIFL